MVSNPPMPRCTPRKSERERGSVGLSVYETQACCCNKVNTSGDPVQSEVPNRAVPAVASGRLMALTSFPKPRLRGARLMSEVFTSGPLDPLRAILGELL